MLGASITSKVRSAARRFAGADQGNIAVIFAIALVPMIGFIGAAIDYTRANSARSAMQSALDSTALMLSKNLTDGSITEADIDAKAKIYFAALYNNKDSTVPAASIQGTYTAKDATGASTVKVTGSGYINTNFMKVASNTFDKLNFNTASTATWGTARMRVAMVLDVTGSMDDDNKIANLKSAATAMVTTLSKLKKVSGDVYISLIPFSRDVNIKGTAAEDWVTGWPAWESEPAAIKASADKPDNWKNYGPGSNCPFDNQKFRCVETPVSGSASTTTIPDSGTYKGYICPGVDSGTANYYNGCYTSVYKGTTTNVTLCTGWSCSCSAYEINGDGSNSCSCSGSGSSKTCKQKLRDYDHVWVSNARSTWNGCVIDRDQNYDTTSDAPTLGDAAKQFIVEQYSACPQAITPMTDTWSTLTGNIDKLTPNGNTNQGIGGAWGWFTLIPNQAPLPAPAKDTGYTYNDYLIWVSDGMNTQNRWYTNSTSIDNRQKILCDNLKMPPYNIKVFTIQINTDTVKPDPTSAVLQYCASGPDNFQMITSAGDTAKAFENVTTQLSKLRVSK